MRLKKYRGNRRSSVERRRTVGVQGVINTLLHKQGWTDKFHERRIFEVWESIVGTPIATQSVPVSLSGGVLRVEVAHSLYATELSAMKTEILSKLAKKIDGINVRGRRPVKKYKVTDIRFLLNPHISKKNAIEETGKSDAEVSKQVLRSVPPEMMDRIESAVSIVNDVELRDALKTLFVTQYCYTEPENDKQT